MEDIQEKKKLTTKQKVFVSEYLKCFNASEAARRAGYSESTAYAMGWENLRKPEIRAEIDARLEEVHMGANEALKLTADLARIDIGVFFKVIDEWVFNPLPTYEIIDEKEVLDDTKEPPEKRISYRVRHVAIDMDKITDPRYSWMLKSFSDSHKFGLKIETHDRHAAIRDVLKLHGKIKEPETTVKVEIVYANSTNNAPEPTHSTDTDQAGTEAP